MYFSLQPSELYSWSLRSHCFALYAQMASSSAQTSWQGWLPSWSARAPCSWGDDDGGANVADMTPAEAGQELFDTLVELKLRGVLSARQVCTLACLAAKAGAKGVERLGMAPDKQTGKYSRHFDHVAGGEECKDDLYHMGVPRRSKIEATVGSTISLSGRHTRQCSKNFRSPRCQWPV